MMRASSIPVREGKFGTSADLEERIRQWGHRIFGLMDRAESRQWLSSKRFYRRLMDWTMRNEAFKTQLFRFVDVLPSLNSSAEVSRHLREYLGDQQVKLSPALRLGLSAASLAPWLAALAVKQQIAGLARQFMLGNDSRQILATLQRRHQQGLSFTIDILGETVVSEAEADQYAARYLEVMALLASHIPQWSSSRVEPGSDYPVSPRLNMSIKLSALCSQIHPADPERAMERIAGRLRPILRRAQEVGALINFDMEQNSLRALTLKLFQAEFGEGEFAEKPAAGLVIQAYLKEAEGDLRRMLAWARARQRRISIRLVKGAYWDYETILASQKGWPVPVFASKAETDANYERLCGFLLENVEIVEPAFATHNVRSIGHVLARVEELGLGPNGFEFQMLYGMADDTKQALVELGYHVREYCPIGDLLPGMAYLVRRLLENTSNQGFLAQSHHGKVSREQLLQNPSAAPAAPAEASADHGMPRAAGADLDGFRNEPPADFWIDAKRQAIEAAIVRLRASLGREQPLIINHRPVRTREWSPSLNPANQDEIIGQAAQGTLVEAEAAVSAARAASSGWARTPAESRSGLLQRLAQLLRRDWADLCALEILEAGKNWTEADADVVEAIDFCNYYAASMRHLGRAYCPQQVAGESNLQHWWPRGVALVIAPWNFPLAILTGMTMAAVVTGNTVVIKPSDQTPIIAARLVSLLIEAALPAGVVNLVLGPGGSVGEYLVAHPAIDVVAFTGSQEVGRRIWQMAGVTGAGQRGLKKVVCEMGGKNAIIVDSDADLDEAVAGTISSAFGYSGQKCSACSRVIPVQDCFDRFVARLIEAAASLPVGSPEEPGTVVGPVISRQAQERILQAIAQGKGEATLAWQGYAPSAPNACYVPPTIFTNVSPESRLFREEIFGPVLSVTKARDFAEALHLANTSTFALTGGIYSRSPRHIDQARAEFVCGNLYINRSITGATVGRQPFGGFKMSGGGTKAGGPEYLENFMVPRVVTENCMRRGFAAGDTAQGV